MQSISIEHENIDVNYHLSLKDYMDTVFPSISGRAGLTVTLFMRCYGGTQTNGETPLAISNHIQNVCRYNNEVKLLS
jgi:hypothetical protein